MKKLLYAGILTLALTALGMAGRANKVWHWDEKSSSFVEITSSAGNCRHHLEAHPLDYVEQAAGTSSNPSACN
jgi:hypothetical protein